MTTDPHDVRTGGSVSTRRIRVLGVGMGPQHVTPEVAAALRSVDYVVAAEKSADDGLLALRRAVCSAYDVALVAVPDPARTAAGGYVGGVRDWHAARVAAYRSVLEAQPGDVAFLVWGDPSLYDSTIRVVASLAPDLDAEWDVLPGVSAPSLLAARHRMVLHEVGRPVHVTTGRLLPTLDLAGRASPAGRAGRDQVAGVVSTGSTTETSELSTGGHLDSVVVMLGSAAALGDLGLDDWQVWWGANLGTPGERLAAGVVGRVLPELLALRGEAREADGWVMEVFLLRAPGLETGPERALLDQRGAGPERALLDQQGALLDQRGGA